MVLIVYINQTRNDRISLIFLFLINYYLIINDVSNTHIHIYEEYTYYSNQRISRSIVGNPNFHRSNDHEESQPKIWYYQDRYQKRPEKEVELEMDNNISYNRIYTTPDLSLVIKSFSIADVGIYRCHGKEGQEKENKYNYRIERKFMA